MIAITVAPDGPGYPETVSKGEMKTIVITDSASGLTPSMAHRRDIVVVPLRVSVNGVEYPETQMDAEHFYRLLAEGATVTTSQPSPGDFVKAYADARDAGADRVISIHISGSLSGTINSARLAAEGAVLPVEVMDTATASMASGLAVLAAAQALAGDPTADAAPIVKAEVAAQRNIFISLDPVRLEAGGRAPGLTEPIPVLSMTSGGLRSVASATTVAEAVEVMVDWLGTEARDMTAWVGEGGAARLGDRLWTAVRRRGWLRPLGRYTVPPSIGANTGPTVGLVISPLNVQGML